jgi:hypothetical protein
LSSDSAINRAATALLWGADP